MSGATARPWFYSKNLQCIGSDAPEVLGNVICDAPIDEDHSMEAWPANAALIVKAVNSFDEMKAALEAAKQFITNGIEFGYIRMPDEDLPDSAHKTPGLIDAALAKARGES